MMLETLFNDTGDPNWDAIGPVSNIILVTCLILITIYYAYQTYKQAEAMRKTLLKDRLYKEMEQLVSPLYSNIGNPQLFSQLEFIGRVVTGGDRLVEYNWDFWENIKQNKYLGTVELINAIDNYLAQRKTNIRDFDNTLYPQAENLLCEAIRRRKGQLSEEINQIERPTKNKPIGRLLAKLRI
jgi:hypothetical protein